MVEKSVIESVLSLEDSEFGGDNALDGFEFQMSSAIYLLFEELKNKNEFQLVYEKLEDFIIFSSKINLYQAKSISKNLTPGVLSKKNNITKNDSCPLSIIEKMNENYLSVKEVAGKYEVTNSLLWNESYEFSKQLSDIDNIKLIRELNLHDLKDTAKYKIVDNTKYSDYPWSDLSARRIFPKENHEQLTRDYISRVILEHYGESKINSYALYNSLCNEIKKIRKNKSLLTSDYLIMQINKYSEFEKELKIKDFISMLSIEDQGCILIYKNFEILKHTIVISNHPNKTDYMLLCEYYNRNLFKTHSEMYESLTISKSFIDFVNRYNEYELKALVLLVIVKEMYI